MINKHSTALGSQQEPIIASANLCEEDTVLAHCTHKLASAVKDEYFAIHAKDQHEAGQL